MNGSKQHQIFQRNQQFVKAIRNNSSGSPIKTLGPRNHRKFTQNPVAQFHNFAQFGPIEPSENYPAPLLYGLYFVYRPFVLY